MPKKTIADNFTKTVDAAKEFVFSQEPENLAVSDLSLKKAVMTGIVESYNGYYTIKAEINADTEEVIFYAYPGVLVLPENEERAEMLIKDIESFDIKIYGVHTLEINGGWLCAKQVESFKDKSLGKSDFYKFVENAVNFIFLFKDYFAKTACGMEPTEPIDEHIISMNKRIIEDTKREIAEMLGCDPDSLEDFGVVNIERIEKDECSDGEFIEYRYEESDESYENEGDFFDLFTESESPENEE